MKQNDINFKVNIEKLDPHTGKLLYVDRMTNSYAQAHPFNVDEYLESIYQKYADNAEFSETRENLRRMWDAVIGDMKPGGDANLYPNRRSPHPALLEVWTKAGNYWRRGLRKGDAIPALEPMCKITRLEDGSWISLFDKDKALLSGEVVTAQTATQVVKGNLTTENAPHTAPSNEIQEIVDARTDEVEENGAAWKKVAFGAAAAVVALVAINTLGLFGMAAAGLLVGGLIK